MPRATSEPTTSIEKTDRCEDLSHRPRVLLGKLGLDGHDRGVKLIARLMRDSGIHVIYSGLWQTPQSIAISARDEDVDCVACSMMSNSHLILMPGLIKYLAEAGRSDILVNVGGIIPQEDIPTLKDAGVNEIFHTGTGLDVIVNSVRDESMECGNGCTLYGAATAAPVMVWVHHGAHVYPRGASEGIATFFRRYGR